MLAAEIDVQLQAILEAFKSEEDVLGGKVNIDYKSTLFNTNSLAVICGLNIFSSSKTQNQTQVCLIHLINIFDGTRRAGDVGFQFG